MELDVKRRQTAYFGHVMEGGHLEYVVSAEGGGGGRGSGGQEDGLGKAQRENAEWFGCVAWR